MEINKDHNETGVFGYEVNGFSYKVNDIVAKIKWMDIESLIAYKADLLTTDEIRMDISYNNLQLTITEETPGWERFISKAKSIFPSIPVDWDLQIVNPSFSTNQITLYQKEHYKIFADFNNTDTFGRVRLNTNGSLQDIHKLGDYFKENIYVLLDDEEGLQIFGHVKYSAEETIWVAEVDWANFIEN
ncbi:MAG: cell division protein [Segetibacter sp.]|nr:cell division protein [Segetibacter sp.]